jgi:hypothetical protein
MDSGEWHRSLARWHAPHTHWQNAGTGRVFFIFNFDFLLRWRKMIYFKITIFIGNFKHYSNFSYFSASQNYDNISFVIFWIRCEQQNSSMTSLCWSAHWYSQLLVSILRFFFYYQTFFLYDQICELLFSEFGTDHSKISEDRVLSLLQRWIFILGNQKKLLFNLTKSKTLIN